MTSIPELLVPEKIQSIALNLQKQSCQPLAAYIYDLPALCRHLQRIKADLPKQVELFYAVKANPDSTILRQVAELVDGLEIASGGELDLIAPYMTDKPFIFGGPAKLDQDLERALSHQIDMLHIESAWELERVIALAEQKNTVIPILLRLNPVLPDEMQTTLTMAGRATAFGIDEEGIEACIERANSSTWVDLHGFHIHALSHQLEAVKHLQLLSFLIERAQQLCQEYGIDLRMLNLGGGIGVNYREPEQQYDWPVFAEGLSDLIKCAGLDKVKIRFEMGRFLTAFCGYYVMEVLDLKKNHGQHFAICRGGTHQFRLPAAQSHSHPFYCLAGQSPLAVQHQLSDIDITVAGQLCTPKDVLARATSVKSIAVGDLLIFPLAGAYAWNISHQQFLCHPAPDFYYLEATQ